MKFLAAISALAGIAASLPSHIKEIRSLEVDESASQPILARADDTANELVNGGSTCPPIIFIIARGSTESGNLGTMGPIIGPVLKSNYGAANVWLQGVGGAYTASLLDNLATDGTSAAAITEMKTLLTLANTKCPKAKIVAAGYSQGAALVAAAIRDTTATIRDQIKGVVLFGYTKNKQNNGQIVNYPSARLKVFCASGDLVCSGSLIITSAHTSYGPDMGGAGPQFLIARINAS
ncbi:cutinase-domain-containing protein [Podospora appendiculata]|uniref:cutinase n=1 Tax=Podospora appendiculata TaxID=314037 RepID=A0AAE1CIK6_9PEZI|nr:cutinase-domain-containing protein [Podospora appendiculata]